MRLDRNQYIRWANAGVALTLIAVFANHGRERRGVSGMLADLAIAGGYRIIEPRVSLPVDYARFRLTSAGARLASVLRGDPHLAVEANHLEGHVGLASLLLGSWDRALQTFERSGAATDPLDRCAAFYMRGVATDSLADFGRALEALRDAGDSPEATFNRALIFEQMTDLDSAAVEWERYLAKDPSSEWSDEARRHLDAARQPSTPEVWRRNKPLLLRAAIARNVAEVRQLTRRHPLAARRMVELELLPAWGEAYGRGDERTAAQMLIAARVITAQRPVQEERLLESAIAEITVAARPDRTVLAAAYAAYGRGMAAFDGGKLPDAVTQLSGAKQLAGSRSPAFEAIVTPPIITTHVARFDPAGAQKLIDATRRRYGDRLDRFLTFAARLDWLEGLCRIVRRDPTGALRSYQRALVVYDRLGEAEYRAAQHINQADAYTYLGDVERADKHLRNALRYAANAEDPTRLHGTLRLGADFLLDVAGPEAAVALQNRLVRFTLSTKDPSRIADALVSRSPILTRAGRRTEALRDVAEAMRLTTQIPDEPTRKRRRADASTAEAFAYRDQDDRRVVASLSSAIDLYRSLDLRPFLAQLILERGRAYARLGNFDAAELDFRAGVDELEQQRGAVADAELRITYLDRADRVFVNLAELLLRQGKNEEAFDFLERSRARELLDRTFGRPVPPLPVREIQAHLPEDAVLVTHTLGETTLITFIVTRHSMRAMAQQVDLAHLKTLLDAINAGFESDTLPQDALRELGRLLIDDARLPAGQRVVFIPDRMFQSVPFAALRIASGRYLIEERTIALSPSATLLTRVAPGRTDHPSLLAVASSDRPDDFPDLSPLTSAPNEAKRVASHYANSRIVLGSDPDAQALLEISRAFDVLHFAGHSVLDSRAHRRSALLVGAKGRITAADIEAADLSHLRLVVLGGCNTGLGKSYRSEGVMSLARSFLVASVPAVVGTISPVGESDPIRLLDAFHEIYARNGDAADALREAQLRMLRSGKPDDAEPARWSSFQVVRGATNAERR